MTNSVCIMTLCCYFVSYMYMQVFRDQGPSSRDGRAGRVPYIRSVSDNYKVRKCVGHMHVTIYVWVCVCECMCVTVYILHYVCM